MALYGIFTKNVKFLDDIFMDKNPYTVAFGKRVRGIRKQQGISQEQLAHLAQIDRSYMGKIERGEFNLTLTKIYQLSNALQISVVELFLESDIIN